MQNQLDDKGIKSADIKSLFNQQYDLVTAGKLKMPYNTKKPDPSNGALDLEKKSKLSFDSLKNFKKAM